MEDNDITGNRVAGLAVTRGGKPTVRGNRINGNKTVGVRIGDGGLGVVEDNDLTRNVRGAWDIKKDDEPNVTRARNKE